MQALVLALLAGASAGDGACAGANSVAGDGASVDTSAGASSDVSAGAAAVAVASAGCCGAVFLFCIADFVAVGFVVLLQLLLLCLASVLPAVRRDIGSLLVALQDIHIITYCNVCI